MKNIICIMMAAIMTIAGVEAKPEVRPEIPVRPVEMKVDGKKEMPKFHGKRHGHKHHARPHGMKRPDRKPMMDAPIVRPVRKHVMRKPEMNAFIVRPVRRVMNTHRQK